MVLRKMPPRVRFFYDQFEAGANKANPFHPMDEERFYHFIWAAHLGRTKFDDADLERQLLEDDFDPEDAEQLASIYDHCRRFMDSRLSIPYVVRQTDGKWVGHA